MYPKSVQFIACEPGPAGVELTWDAPTATSDAIIPASFVVYRSRVPITPDDSEAFYAGVFGSKIRPIALPGDTRALIDSDPPSPVWYLVLAQDPDHNLFAVSFEVAPCAAAPRPVPDDALGPPPETDCSHPYRSFPDLVFRTDDAAARITIQALAKSLSTQYGDGDQTPDDPEETAES